MLKELLKTQDYELPTFAFRRIPLKSWDAVGTMVWEYLKSQYKPYAYDGPLGENPIQEIQAFDFNRIHRSLTFRIKYLDVDCFGEQVQLFLDLIREAYTPGTSIENFFKKRVGNDIFRKVGIGLLDRSFYFKVTEKKVLLSETHKTETTYAFANSFYRFSMKIPGRSSKWISTKRLRNFVLAADASKAKDHSLKRAMTGAEPFPAYDSEEYAMHQMFSEIFYIKRILDDMNKDKQFRSMDYPKEIDE